MTERASEPTDGLREYLQQIGQYEILEAEDEIRLGKQVQNGLAAQWQLLEPDSSHSAEEIEALMERVETGHLASEQFIHANLRYVVSLAKRYKRARMSLMDAIQYGNLGLIDAVHSYDPEKGFRFSTHANWHIRSAIVRGIRVSDDATVLASKTRQQLLQLDKYAKEPLTGRMRTEEEMAEILGVPMEKLRTLQAVKSALRNTFSIDQPLSQNGEATYQEFLADRTSYGDIENSMFSGNEDEVRGLLGLLTRRQRQVIELRYGLSTGKLLTQEETAKLLGQSRQAVSQIEARALERIRNRADPRTLSVAIGEVATKGS